MIDSSDKSGSFNFLFLFLLKQLNIFLNNSPLKTRHILLLSFIYTYIIMIYCLINVKHAYCVHWEVGVV